MIKNLHILFYTLLIFIQLLKYHYFKFVYILINRSWIVNNQDNKNYLSVSTLTQTDQINTKTKFHIFSYWSLV